MLIEMLIDLRKLLFWQKNRNSDCELLRHIFGIIVNFRIAKLCGVTGAC